MLLAGFLAGCIKDGVKRKYTFYRPVYKTTAEVKQGIKSSQPVAVEQPGKLFYKDGYVFLNELDKGVHIIDVRNPTTPRVVSFVAIPGCVDLAVRGSYLYADLYTDLVSLDISDPLNVKVAHYIEGVFPHRKYDNYMIDTNLVITDWVRVDTMVRSLEGSLGWGVREDMMVTFALTGTKAATTNGTGGSMARFALSDDRMYTVSHSDIKVFNTANPAIPVYVKLVDVGTWDVETIYPFGQYLFLGSQTGMYIYDISSKDNPVQQGKFTHARVCDPVVSDGRYAYVTLRNGTECGGFINQLDVVDVARVTNPFLVKSYPMTNPHGLAKDGNLLLICDGKDGLRILDAAMPTAIREKARLQGMDTYDVIALDGIALVSAKGGLYLVDYRNPEKPFITGSVVVRQ